MSCAHGRAGSQVGGHLPSDLLNWLGPSLQDWAGVDREPGGASTHPRASGFKAHPRLR